MHSSAGTVIVGAGQSGLSAAMRLRALGYDKVIQLVGDESCAPYQRPPLSKKFLAGAVEPQALQIRPPEFYADQRIDLRLGVRATHLDATARSLRLSDGSELPFESLVLATGTRARRLPAAMGADLSGVHVLRSQSDAAALSLALQPGQRLVVVGGGFVGLEAAATARQLGMEVTVLEQAPRILQRVAGMDVSERLRTLHQSHGVQILEQRQLAALRGEGGQVREVALTDGQCLPADVVLVGIGAEVNTDLAQSAGLDVQDGIVVDQHGQTRLAGIYACGDCARFPWRGGSVRLESVQNAIAQAECVAQAIAGQPVSYAPTPWFWSDQYDCKLQMAGLTAGHDAVVVRDSGATATQGASFWYFREGQLMAVEALNDASAFIHARRWMEQGSSPLPGDLADTSRALKSLAVH